MDSQIIGVFWIIELSVATIYRYSDIYRDMKVYRDII